jgi:hypothetical protein
MARSAWARNHPAAAELKNPILRFFTMRSGRTSWAARLRIGRDASAVLDQLVVEEGHTDLERMGHGGAVEVVEHVVHERELSVQVEESREVSTGVASDPGADDVTSSVEMDGC